jgi:hydroxymethylpyrimidine/phosphomethylpyrimidine kinase
MSNNESIEFISHLVNLYEHQCSKKLLLSCIQLDRKESLEQPYLEQQTRALLPNKELYLPKTTLCREIERTRLESKNDVMKRAERLHSSSTISKVLLKTGRKKECEFRIMED